MDPITIAAIVGGAASIIGGLFTNKSNKKRQEEANKANLSNQQAMWEATNEYNDPTNQMIRLQKAGLNPNLIYGSGAPYNTASNQNVPDFKSYEQQNPLENVPSILSDYANVKQQQQRISNETLVATTNAANTAADTLNKGIQGEGMQFDLDQRRRLADNAYELSELNLAQAQEQLIKQQIENSQLPEMHKSLLEEAAARRSLLGSQISTEALKREQMRLQMKLQKAGLENAPWWSRFIFRFYEEADPVGALKDKEGWKSNLNFENQKTYWKSKLNIKN